MEIADFQKMEQIRNRAAKLVNDPKTAESSNPITVNSVSVLVSMTAICRLSPPQRRIDRH